MNCIQLKQNEVTGFLEIVLAKIPRDQMRNELMEAHRDSCASEPFEQWLFNLAASNSIYSAPARYYLVH